MCVEATRSAVVASGPRQAHFYHKPCPRARRRRVKYEEETTVTGKFGDETRVQL